MIPEEDGLKFRRVLGVCMLSAPGSRQSEGPAAPDRGLSGDVLVGACLGGGGGAGEGAVLPFLCYFPSPERPFQYARLRI